MATLSKFGKNNFKSGLLIIYLVSFMLVQFSLNIGFSFKPYMFISAIIILVSLASNKTKSMVIKRKMLIYEVFMITFVIYATIRNFFAGDILLGFKGSIALCFSLFVYYFTFYTFKGIKNERTFRFIYKSGIIILLIIAAGFILKDDRIFELDRSVNRLRGYIQDPNFFALYFVLPMIVFLFYSIREKKNWLITIISVFAIFLTYSRAAYLSLILGTIYLLFLLRDDIPKFYRKILISVLVIIIGLWIFSSLDITEQIWNTALQNITARFSETASRNARELLIKIGIETFKENPIFGVGMLNVRYYTYSLVHNNYLHNTYLEVFVEQGMIGGFLYLGFILSFIMTKCNNIHSKIMKAVIVCQLMMIFFLTAVNNEALFLSMGLFRAVNFKDELK